jgi:hypothetical protein
MFLATTMYRSVTAACTALTRRLSPHVLHMITPRKKGPKLNIATWTNRAIPTTARAGSRYWNTSRLSDQRMHTPSPHPPHPPHPPPHPPPLAPAPPCNCQRTRGWRPRSTAPRGRRGGRPCRGGPGTRCRLAPAGNRAKNEKIATAPFFAKTHCCYHLSSQKQTPAWSSSN